MPEALYQRWYRFWQIEPFGPVQEDLRAALSLSLYHAVHRPKSGKAMDPTDWFKSLQSGEQKKPLTPEEFREQLLAVGANDAHVNALPDGLF